MPPAEDQPLTNMWANQFLVQQSATQQQSESGLTRGTQGLDHRWKEPHAGADAAVV